MTHFTGGREIQYYVTRVQRLGIIIIVTTVTSVGCTVVITLMAIVTSDGCVRACERPHGTVIERGRHPCVLVVAVSASCRELLSDVVWIGGGVVIISMTTGTGVGRVCIVTLVTIVARHGGMRTHNRIEGVIQR